MLTSLENPGARQRKWILATLATITVTYCVAVLAFVATSPDLALRALLVNQDGVGPHNGVQIRRVLLPVLAKSEGIHHWGQYPQAGDYLISIAGHPLRGFHDFARAHVELRRSRIAPDVLPAGTDPLEQEALKGGITPLIEFAGSDQVPTGRAAKVLLWRPEWKSPRESWLRIGEISAVEVAQTVLWFVLHLAIFGVAVLACWNRPFDRSAWLFFATCLLSLCAFVGGFHWWVVAGSLPLTIPFAVSAVFLPPAVLHFFLVYPQEPPWLRGRHSTGWLAIGYGVPAIAVILISSLVIGIYATSGSAEQLAPYCQVLRTVIFVYMAISLVYFVLSMAAILHNATRTTNVLERKQLAWIMWAAVISMPMIVYTVYLAYFEPDSFALGQARLPMLGVTLLFSAAYAVGIIRYRLLLSDELFGQGMLYYLAGYALTAVFSMVVTLASLAAAYLGAIIADRFVSVAFILMPAVVLLLWYRDQVQQVIDQWFFGERVRLQRALHQVQTSSNDDIDHSDLSRRMLASCREALRIEHGAVYLRAGKGTSFQLVAQIGERRWPAEFVGREPLLASLSPGTTVMWVPRSSGEELPDTQKMLRELGAFLVQGLDWQADVVGIAALGRKIGGAPFTDEDVTFLNAISQITGVALHCARVQQGVTELSHEIEERQATIDAQRRQIAVLHQQLAKPAASLVEAPAVDSAMVPAIPAATFDRSDIVGHSAAMATVLRTAERVAHSDASVLVRGESGTGKEVLARAIHRNSDRQSGPMISVHCASLSPSLLESELFGHAKGAFTGAHKDRVGRFEAAHGGTLFLDEIGDITLETQVKLLRVLQERKFEPVGSQRTVTVDVRLITATHRDLETMIRQGEFREDLFYRLNVVSIQLPPLRDRGADVIELAGRFLQSASQRSGQSGLEFDARVLEALEKYTWPGNIRELQNAIERAVVLADGPVITLGHLPLEVREALSFPLGSRRNRTSADAVGRSDSGVEYGRYAPGAAIGSPGLTDRRAASLRQPELLERQELEAALKAHDGNKAEAARALGMPRSTLYSKLKKYRLS